MWTQFLLLLGFGFLILNSEIQLGVATLYPDDKIKKSKQPQAKAGPLKKNVFDRELVKEKTTDKEILYEHQAYYHDTATRRFNGTVLGYVTPWNAHGYDVAQMFGKKFDIISPVWFQIVYRDNNYLLVGAHDIDSGWLGDVRRKSRRPNGENVKFFPRVNIANSERFQNLLQPNDKTKRDALNKLIVETCQEYQFQGIVLEVWMQFASAAEDHVEAFIIEMAEALRKHNLNLILVIPPLRAGMTYLFTSNHFNRLYPHVLGFSLMTYDYSNIGNPGANAPLPWMRHSIEHIVPNNAVDKAAKRQKIFMGLNMYGNDYTPSGGAAIIADQYLNLLKSFKGQFLFDKEGVEHFFYTTTNTGRHTVFYPTLLSTNERIKLAEEMGVGIAIWELGQGLDYFYDLF